MTVPSFSDQLRLGAGEPTSNSNRHSPVQRCAPHLVDAHQQIPGRCGARRIPLHSGSGASATSCGRCRCRRAGASTRTMNVSRPNIARPVHRRAAGDARGACPMGCGVAATFRLRRYLHIRARRSMPGPDPARRFGPYWHPISERVSFRCRCSKPLSLAARSPLSSAGRAARTGRPQPSSWPGRRERQCPSAASRSEAR